MEGASNGGMLYHEMQELGLCAVHCVNTLLQGPFFSEIDLAALATDLDRQEHQMMLQGGVSSGDFLPGGSHNVSLQGDFSIQVLQKALEVWDLQVIPFDCPVAKPAQIDPELENAFICHLYHHWFCVRKVNGEWYNFDSLYAGPQHLSKFYLSAYMDSLRRSGWSIFLVRGNFPKECPLSPNGYGQWFTPDDADKITKLCSMQPARPKIDLNKDYRENHCQLDDDENLNAAIAASLMDISSAIASVEASTPQNENKNNEDKAA